VEDFDLDAGILFSDILFPLDVLGMGLSFSDSGPILKKSAAVWDHLKALKVSEVQAKTRLAFQGEAIERMRGWLTPMNKGCIGFVGAPWTLFVFACHRDSTEVKQGLEDGRFLAFVETLMPALMVSASVQAKAGPDLILVFDTSAGLLSPMDFQQHVVPVLSKMFVELALEFPAIQWGYFAKDIHESHLKHLTGLPISYLGFDWRWDLSIALNTYGTNYAIQGTLDPEWLLLPRETLELKLLTYFESVSQSDHLGSWVANLGHGIIKTTPEENVQLLVKTLRTFFKDKGLGA
jgi:uroporphyrinogen decarboxylase